MGVGDVDGVGVVDGAGTTRARHEGARGGKGGVLVVVAATALGSDVSSRLDFAVLTVDEAGGGESASGVVDRRVVEPAEARKRSDDDGAIRLDRARRGISVGEIQELDV
jgi:hypothetical protein